jgi:hypothetical protein
VDYRVLGRAGAAGYLERVARELSVRGLDGGLVAEAAAQMRESSDLFRTLRYEDTLPAAGDLLGRIADVELDALDLMERAWPEVGRSELVKGGTSAYTDRVWLDRGSLATLLLLRPRFPATSASWGVHE